MSIPAAVVAEVETRAGDQCEACGFTIHGKADLHHRKAKGMGGRPRRELDVAGNLIRVHPLCHTWIHAHPTISKEMGWIVADWQDFTEVLPVVEPSLYRWAA